MRPISLTILAAIMVVALTAMRPAEASGVPTARPDGRPSGRTTATAILATPPRPVDDHADSRVGVQLVVVGIAAGLVAGVGTAAHLLRRKLGLTAYTPDQNAGGHH